MSGDIEGARAALRAYRGHSLPIKAAIDAILADHSRLLERVGSLEASNALMLQQEKAHLRAAREALARVGDLEAAARDPMGGEGLASVAALWNTRAPQAGEPKPEDKGNHDCLAKRRPGEPWFDLLGRDPDAHNLVRLWAERRLAAGGDPEHCQMGLDMAERMRAYAADPANRPASAPPAEAYPPVPAGEPKPLLVEFDRETGYLKDPVEGGEPKPVAWRVRVVGDGRWNFWDEDPAFDEVIGGGDRSRFVVEPLFAHPPKSDQDVVRLVEAAQELMEIIDGAVQDEPAAARALEIDSFTCQPIRAALDSLANTSEVIRRAQPARPWRP